jgi:hypothetical protein
LTSPDASPESLCVAPDIARIIRDGKPSPAPSPIRIIAGSRSVTYVAWTGVRASRSSPARTKPIAGTSVAFGPNRRLSFPVKRKDMVPITTVIGR